MTGMSEVVELITSTRQSFMDEDDVNAIRRIDDSLLATRKQRQSRRQESRATLLELSRSLESAQNQLQSTKDSVEVDHDTLMNGLDREKFGLAKGINDLESTNHSLESQLARLQSELANLETNPEKIPGAFNKDESTVLKLNVYRDLGIQFKEENGVYTKAIVRSANDKDVHIVTLEPGESYTDQLWQLCD